MNRKLFVPMLATALIFLASGCSESPSESSTAAEFSLEDEFGGYTAGVESPGFGESDLLDEAANDEAFDDILLASPEVDSVVSDPDVGRYHMRIVWGQLRYDSTVTDVTDWSGSLTISRGVEILRRVVHFELGQDYIPTRTDRKLIEWVSYTTVHNDGIVVDLFVPPVKPVLDTTWVEEVIGEGDTVEVAVVDTVYPEVEPVTVAFETGPYSRVFRLDELASLDTIVYLADSNAVAFHAFKKERMPCPGGFLAGRWGFDEEGRGRFRGVWMTARGRIVGYLRGHFGQNQDGLKVFFGKWISASGEFEGFLKGTYGHLPGHHSEAQARHRAHGWFAGKVYDADRTEIGALRGRYRNAPRFEGGFFQGGWRLRCANQGEETGNGGNGL